MTVQVFVVLLHVVLWVLCQCKVCSCLCVEACNTVSVTSRNDDGGNCVKVPNKGMVCAVILNPFADLNWNLKSLG